MITIQELEKLKSANEILQKDNINLQNTVTYLTEQLDWFKRQIFGKKSERIVAACNSEQLLFDGFEDLQNQDEPEL